ncbi:hypothetical protein [Saccharothrix sp. HUAS TT1]|uniref:hypothetical protein n=1 Tax=unclassified Saccharothrix TaxID=2593673 RepID=UPI00345BD3D1
MHRLPSAHRSPTAPRGVTGTGPAAPQPPTGAHRLPTVAALHHRVRVLLGLAVLGALVVLLALGAQAVVPLAVCAAAAATTYLLPPVRFAA